MRVSWLWLLVFVSLFSSCDKSTVEEGQTAREPVAAPENPAAIDKPSTESSNTDSSPANPAISRNLLTKEEVADGWIALFDGTTLFGWTSNNKDMNWHVENNAITADAEGRSLLLTNVPYADYELICEYRMQPKGNSGVFLRTLPNPADVTRDCFEVNIADEHPENYLTGSLVGRARTDEPIKGSGDWQTLKMVADGDQIRIEHNGRKVLEYKSTSESDPRSGLIGLQKNEGKIEFRKVILKPLGMKALFNGKDLSGWREVPGSKSKFVVHDSTIDVVGGQGFLETEETFGDFVFQTDARTNSKGINSGFFFRAMPGTEEAPSNGYEVQIDNAFKGNRDTPTNSGTGAIFRRAEARRVVADDLGWCKITLVAHGPRFAVWVDGYPVVDWEDSRDPHENPRRGKRLEPGHISLQGHDETTNISFRKLEISAFPK